jgi:hypothetical protein
MKRAVFALAIMICLVPATIQAVDVYESVYQVPLKVTYCSATPNDTNVKGEYPCDSISYRHTTTYTGYQKQFNPDDPKLICQKDTTCPVDTSTLIYSGLNLVSPNMQTGVTGDLFRYYIPKGTVEIDLSLYGPPTYGQAATIACLGAEPTGAFPTSFSQFSNPSLYPTIFPPAQYPDAQAFRFGKSLKQLAENEWFAVNDGGYIHVVYNPPIDLQHPLESGQWLYVKYKRYDTSQIPVHQYLWGANKAAYKAWYDTATFGADGDPLVVTNTKPAKPVVTLPINSALNPQTGETEWLTSPQSLSVSCSAASIIYYTFTKTEDGSEPLDPVLPSATANDGSISASSGKIVLSSTAGASSPARYKYRFVGVNQNGAGAETGILKYAIDLTAPALVGIPVTDKPSGTSVSTSPLKITVTSSKATKIYYELTENATEPNTPTVDSLSISGPSGEIALNGTANQKKTIKIIFRGWNDNGSKWGDPSAVFTYIIDLSPVPPGNVSVSPGPASYASAVTLGLSSANATRIYGEIRTTIDGSEPGDPPEPSINSSISLSGPSTTYTLPSTAGITTRSKVRFVGYNAAGLGTSTGVLYYIIDKKSLPGKPTASPLTDTIFNSSPQNITVTSQNAETIYYQITKSEGGTPSDPAFLIGPFLTLKNGQLSLVAAAGLKTTYKVIFMAVNSSGQSISDIYKYIIDLTGSANKPDSVTLSPPSGIAMATAPQQITASSMNAATIEFVYTTSNAVSSLSEPGALVLQTGEKKGSLNGSTGVIEINESSTTSANGIQVLPYQKNTIRMKIAGKNVSGYGPSVEATYVVDLSPKSGETISQDNAKANPNVNVTGFIKTDSGLTDPYQKFLSAGGVNSKSQTNAETLYSVVDLINLSLKPVFPKLTIETRRFDSGNVMIIGDPGWNGHVFPLVVDRLITSSDENKSSFSNAGNLDITINNIRISLSPAGAYENQFSVWLKDKGLNIVYGDGHVGKISLEGSSDLHLVVRHQLGAVAPEKPDVGTTSTLNPNEDGSLQITYGDGTIQNLIPYVHDPETFIESMLLSKGSDAVLDCSNGSVHVPDAINPKWVGLPDYELDSSKALEKPIVQYNSTDDSFEYSSPAGSQTVNYASEYFKQ